MNFAAIPPEINSALIYAGPGSGPMIAAAASWDQLATEMFAAASEYGSLISDLTSGPWQGPASTSMMNAAAPYVSWMNATGVQAEQSANQAKAAAGAYEAAFTATVPPPVIAANRTLLASLLSTNILGQNTPAIAATEAHYAEMWAQDAAAMYSYAESASAATTLAPFAEPPVTTTTTAGAGTAQAVTAGQAAASGTQTTLSQLVTSVPTALQQLAAPATSTSSTSGLDGIMNWLGLGGTNLTSPAGFLSFLAGTDGSPLGAFLNNNGLNTLFSSGFYMPGNFLGTMSDFVGLGSAGAASEAAGDAAAGAATAAGGIDAAAAAPAAGLRELGNLGGGVSAAMGRGPAIGALAVPPSWNAGAAMASGLPSTLGEVPLAAPPAVAAGMPGVPLVNAAENHVNGTMPKYGIRPTVVAHPPAAG